MRGLKLVEITLPFSSVTSHLLQMRGLKLLLRNLFFYVVYVASFTDAWIETRRSATRLTRTTVASFTDAWIETRFAPKLSPLAMRSHLLQMRGLKLF